MSESERRRRDVEGYDQTVDRLEKNIWPTDPSAYGTSSAISLRRIADALEEKSNNLQAEKTAAMMASPKRVQPEHWMTIVAKGFLLSVVILAISAVIFAINGTPLDRFGAVAIAILGWGPWFYFWGKRNLW